MKRILLSVFIASLSLGFTATPVLTLIFRANPSRCASVGL